MLPAAIADWVSRRRIELGLTLRMSAAGLLSFAVGEAMGVSRIYWAVLTAVIVMQASVGGSLKATIDRLAGKRSTRCDASCSASPQLGSWTR